MTTPTGPFSTPGKRWRAKIITSLLYLAIVPAALICAASFFGRFHWFLDLISHFRAQYTGWFAIWAIIAIVTKRKNAATLACLFTALNFVPLAHYYPPPFHSSEPEKRNLRVLTFNVLEDNERGTDVLDWITAQEADVIILQEFIPLWRNTLKPLEKSHPHQYLSPGYWNHGSAIYSKFPISDKKREAFANSRSSYISATILVGKKPLKIFSAHPLSPESERNFNFRNEYLKKLSDNIKKTDSPVIAAGDFNASVFSSSFRKLRRETDLKNAAQGRGFHPTYNQHHPLFGIAIDHILHTASLRCVNHYVGPDLGSDHKPVVADFILKR